jgi:alkylation response protein AidB-like acyl-CoA dehydrogenase
MDFSYPETHNEIKNLTADILGDFSSPERLKKLEAHGPYFDKELWSKLVEAGIHAASLPEAIDGMGMDYAATTMVAEVIGQTMVSIPYIPCIISTALPLLHADTNPVIQKQLEDIVTGKGIAVTAFIEPYNENPLTPKTTAKKNGETYTLSGTKHCVPYANDATNIMLSAIQDDGSLWLGLVNSKAQGVTLIAQQTTANEPQFQLTLNKAEATCIATGDKAQAIMQQSIAMTTMAYCSMACGIAEKMTKIAAEYTSQRKQFGVPIATFQAVAHRLADAFIDAECLKIITIKAVSDVNQGDYQNDTLSMAKAWCGDVLHRVSHTAQHVHGGMGIDRDYHLFRYCLWSKQLELSLGNAKIHIAKIADNLAARYLAAV